MTTVAVRVVGEFVETSANGGAPVTTLNQVSYLRQPDGRRLINDVGAVSGIVANGLRVTVRALDARTLDPAMAAAFVRFVVMKAVSGPGLFAAVRAAVEPRHLLLAWPEWSAVAPSARMAFLRELIRPAASIVVNDRLEARWPFWRALVGRGPWFIDAEP